MHRASASSERRTRRKLLFEFPHFSAITSHLETFVFRKNTFQHIASCVAHTTRLTSNLARIKTIKKPTSNMPPKRAAAATKAAAKDAPAAAAKNKANTAAKVTKPKAEPKKAAPKAPAKARGRPKKQPEAKVEAEPESEAESGSEADSEEEQADEEAETKPKATKTKANGEHIPCIFL